MFGMMSVGVIIGGNDRVCRRRVGVAVVTPHAMSAFFGRMPFGFVANNEPDDHDKEEEQKADLN
ncbi:hypothetical protein [Paenibacillus sp. AD87]|uniref:hypothetical protein n=1 Tax=Paenibacillus sp. AD87 TaxID=1528787 RepID=UPI001E50E6D8|nr:hypothetical protein [Paenibacillus sp. AD87]